MSAGDIPNWALAVANSVMRSVYEKDPETYRHCVRVSRLSRCLAIASGLSDYHSRVVEFAALFHDVGKIMIPTEILLKPGKLTPEEYEIMKSHPVKSAEILDALTHHKFFKEMIPGVLHHHERPDGQGYPHNLIGDNVPIEARIILVADTFDAMTQMRSYRKGLEAGVAHQELRDFAGRQFDPHLVEIFIQAQPLWEEDEKRIAREMHSQVLSLNQEPLQAVAPQILKVA